MASLSGMTLAEMRAATVTAIRTAMKNRIDLLTKRQLILLELWVREFDPDSVMRLHDAATRTYRPDGQIESEATTVRDVLGAKTGSQRVDWTYYASGEVDTITIRDRDAADVETSRKVIKHYLDGQQPTVN